MTGQKVSEACYIHTYVHVVFSGGKTTVQKFFKLIYLFISSLSLLQLGFGSAAVRKSLAPLRGLLLFLPRQQLVYSVQRSCCNVQEWEGGKTAIGKPAAYEQSPPSAVFLSFKIASCKERTTGMGSCHFYCLATVILTEDRKQYIRSKLKTNSYTICYGGSSHME